MDIKPHVPFSLITRRNILKTTLGVAIGSNLLVDSKSVKAEDDLEVLPDSIPPSPPTIAWQDLLPEFVTPVSNVDLTPAPTLTFNKLANEAGRLPHQKWNEVINLYGYETYALFAVQIDNWSFNPAYPPQPCWGYQDRPDQTSLPNLPSAVVHAHYGKPIICRIYNNLPADHQGFGVPEINTHLHNLHTASESDGFPGDFYSATIKGPTLTAPGKFKDHLYLNLYAGFSTSQDGLGDPREALGTLFYHDHTENFTAANVYRGLSGFYLLFDQFDSGDENDPSPQALRLPSGEYDYPLALGDRRFDEQGMLYFDQLNSEGILGDKIIINGKIEPRWHVARRKYRLRILNSGPSRFYDLGIVDNRNRLQTFTYIANDGNLLPEPLIEQKTLYLGNAERADIVFDFSRYPIGYELFLVNRLEQSSTRKPDKIAAPGTKIMKIVIDREPQTLDVSRVPAVLRALPDITSAQKAAAPIRQFIFARKGGVWTINDQIFNIGKPIAKIAKNSNEIWELVNPSGGWAHPIHLHLEEGRILKIIQNGVVKTIPKHQRGRKDVFVLEPYTTMQVFVRFRDFSGKYVLHCHNLIHEDHAMMARWDVV